MSGRHEIGKRISATQVCCHAVATGGWRPGLFSPQVRDEPCVAANAAVWARDTYPRYGASAFPASLSVLSGVVGMCRVAAAAACALREETPAVW